jgi:hypothetical protein
MTTIDIDMKFILIDIPNGFLRGWKSEASSTRIIMYFNQLIAC